MIINSKLRNSITTPNSIRSSMIKKNLFIRPDKDQIFIKNKIKDNNNYRTTYNSIKVGDRSIIVKKISLSNIFNINNTTNIRNHPLSLSLTEKEEFDNNSFDIVQKQRANLYNNRIKKVKMIILIQSFIRKFLSNKKYFNDLQKIKSKSYNSVKTIYVKKTPMYKNNFSCKKLPPKNIMKKSIDKSNYLFNKLIIINSCEDKTKISKIQKFWRNRRLNLQVGNYSRISNYQCQSEIVKKFKYNKKISLMKRPKYDSLLFNSLKSLNEEDEINLKNKDIFNKLYNNNNSYIKRPKYIKLYSKNNQTLIKDEYFGEDEDIYQYVVNNTSYRGQSFTLFHDKNQNGNYIQQVISNTGRKINKVKNEVNNINLFPDNNNADNSKEDIKNKFNEFKKINNNLKMWKKNKINSKKYEENILKFKNLKPNKNLICINSNRTEKLLILERKKNIINKPNPLLMKKIDNKKIIKNKKTNIIKNKIISKYFINDDRIEPNLVLERKLFMINPKVSLKK